MPKQKKTIFFHKVRKDVGYLNQYELRMPYIQRNIDITNNGIQQAIIKLPVRPVFTVTGCSTPASGQDDDVICSPKRSDLKLRLSGRGNRWSSSRRNHSKKREKQIWAR